MPELNDDPPHEPIGELFKNWLEIELREAIETFGPEIVSELRAIRTPGPFIDRFLMCLIRANAPEHTAETNIREQLRAAKKAIFGSQPSHRSDKFNDEHALEWKAYQYELDRTEGWSKSKRRSIETLAGEAARFTEGDNPSAAEDRLRKVFSRRKAELVDNLSPKSTKMELIQRAALHDLAERLDLFGITLWPDD